MNPEGSHSPGPSLTLCEKVKQNIILLSIIGCLSTVTLTVVTVLTVVLLSENSRPTSTVIPCTNDSKIFPEKCLKSFVDLRISGGRNTELKEHTSIVILVYKHGW